MSYTVKATVVAEEAEGGVREYAVAGSPTGEVGARCALKFNPGGHGPTEEIKVFCAGAMQSIVNHRDRLKKEWEQAHVEREGRSPVSYGPGQLDALRCMATALTSLETAQMFAVKGLHAVNNASDAAA